MTFEKIPQYLELNDCIAINGGEVQIKKKLSSVIGGVSTYKIMVDFPKEEFEPLYFGTLDELDEWSLGNEKRNIRRCMICNNIPIVEEQLQENKEPGYFYDEELNQYFCCEACRTKWMDSMYGKWNWKQEDEAFMDIKVYTRENHDSPWQPYKQTFIPEFEY